MLHNSPIDQPGWTERFVEHVGITTPDIIKKMRQIWWFNPTNIHSMRLSNSGFKFATTRVNIKHYSHDLETKILPKTLIQLERSIGYPYYIANLSCIKVFDQATSVTLILYNNQLQTYLDNVQKLQ
jgi:hypothetical protein